MIATRGYSWIGHKGPFGRNVKWTCLQLPGIVVRHCGHPTALRPYYVVGHQGTYRRLQQAQAAAIEVAGQPDPVEASRVADELAAIQCRDQTDLFLPVGTIRQDSSDSDGESIQYEHVPPS